MWSLECCFLLKENLQDVSCLNFWIRLLKLSGYLCDELTTCPTCPSAKVSDPLTELCEFELLTFIYVPVVFSCRGQVKLVFPNFFRLKKKKKRLRHCTLSVVKPNSVSVTQWKKGMSQSLGVTVMTLAPCDWSGCSSGNELPLGLTIIPPLQRNKNKICIDDNSNICYCSYGG